MSVQRTPKGWVVRWWAPDGKHPSRTFPTKREAEAFDADTKRAKRHGQLGRFQAEMEGGRKTLAEVGQEFNRVVVSQKQPKTQRLYKWLWNKFIDPELGALPIAAIDVVRIEEWLLELKTGTIAKRKAIALLSQVFKFARKRRYVAENPCELAERPRPPAREPVKPLHPIEVEKVRGGLLRAGRHGDATLVSAMAYAGLRPGEALRLGPSDVTQKLRVEATKTNTFRFPDLLSPVAADLAEWRLKLGPGYDVLFPSQRGKAWSESVYSNWRRRVWHEFSDTNPKDLRHTFVSLLLADPGYSRTEAAEQAGHSLEVQSATYAHPFPPGKAEDVIRAARAEVFGGTADAAGHGGR